MDLRIMEEVCSGKERDPKESWKYGAILPDRVDACVHQRIVMKVASQPERAAVCAWDGELTYGELDELATRLAHRLAGLGVGPEVMVPLCFEKSLWTVVAMLAVLKAGGAFVLLDPSLPYQRLQAIIQQTQARLMLSSILNHPLSSRLLKEVVVIGPDFIRDQQSGINRALQPPSPSSAMYVVFTSGSTGTPKGVVISHASFCSALHYQLSYLGFTPESRVFDFASYSFDVAVHNSLATLVAGGCLCIPSENDRKGNPAKSMAEMKVTITNLTASVARLLDPEMVPSLKTVIMLGEAVSVRDAERWWDKVRFINTYGPAECTPISTINSSAMDPLMATRIGKGVGVVTWVVDANNHDTLLPLGQIGELLLEGPLIGRGYLNDPVKTAAAFIEDPAWLLEGPQGRPGRRGRLYKTGDLVRYNEDGSLTFISRKDTQVKIRGQRVELGEVEQHVHECMPQATQVVAEIILPAGEKVSAVLAAFLHMESNPNSTASMGDTTVQASIAQLMHVPAEVQDGLAERLPGYMVPTLYFAIPELPMTVSGKTDRKRLREIGASFPPQQLAETETAGQAKKRQPTTVAEHQLQQLWARVLNIDPSSISLDDSFFRLGGDSVMAMKLVGEARKARIALTVAEIFRRPKLVDLARLEIGQIDGMAEEIPAFTLLGSAVDAQTVREEVAAGYKIDGALIEDIYPCTPLQESLLSLRSKRPGDYIMQNVLELSSDLQNDAFRAAWEETVRSTAVLRTRIVQSSQLGMLQVVMAESIQWIEANGLEDYLEQDKLASMEPGQPLARYAIVKNAKGVYSWFVWTVHHALYDGWSLPLVMDMVSRAYRGNPLRVQRDFKAFVKYLGEEDRDRTEAYWRSVLADCQSTHFPALPSSVQQPVADTIVQNQCPPLLLTGSDITTSTLIRAAWSVISSRYTSSKDVVFGTTVTGRNAPVADIEDMVGPTIATVPVRVQVLGEQTVTAYLDALQHQATEMIQHEQTGLQRIAKMSVDAQHACDFQTLLVIQPAEDGFGSDETLGVWQTSAIEQGFGSYALTLQCILAVEGIKIIASFDSKVVDPWKLQKMLGQFSFVMQQLAEAGQRQKVADIDLLTQQDKEELWGWYKTMPAAVERCVHYLIEEQARAQPDSPAVCAWDGELTHGELDDLATRLAHRLVGLGVGPEVMVPLCFEKSLWTVVAMLAVLKAGGAFLLLDPSHPPDRLKLLCRKASATVALASPSSVPSIQGFIQTVVVVGKDAINQLPSPKPLNTTVGPNNAAYVIFTSGSTGEPKGCKIEHMSYCSAALCHGPALGIHSGTRSLQFGSYSFAGAIMETLMVLIHGGCVCIPSEDERRSDVGLAIRNLKANWAFLTSSVLATFEPKSVPSLTTLCVGGEPIRAFQIQQWANKVQLRQTYGSAETSAAVSSARLTKASTIGDVGKAATGRYWIVDPADSNKLAPIGAIGEVMIEGPIIGREYVGEPDKTASTFIQAPSWRGRFGQCTRESRFYKSGDLAVYKNDGAIELIGRKDTQVKLRGQRIELGEIEHQARLASPYVRDVAVEPIIPQDGSSKNPVLVGFIVVQVKLEERVESNGDSKTVNMSTQAVMEAVQERLERILPHYMVPTVLIPLPELPMTTSKKADRKRLREIGASFSPQQFAEMRVAGQTEKRQPTTEAERQLQQLWAQVLNIDPGSIGMDDSFFRLGGDSIIATKLVGEARKAGIALTVAEVFRRPKLVDLARLEIGQIDDMAEEIPPFILLGSAVDVQSVREEVAAGYNIDATLIEDIYPCTPLQEGLLSLTSKHPGDYIMQNVLELSSDLQNDAFRAAWEETVRSTAVLRTRIVQHGQLGLLQVVLAESIKWSQADELEDYLKKDKLAVMELGQPLARYALVKDGKGTHKWFVWTVHHALYDGWSLPRVIDMVSRAYRGTPLGERQEFKALVKHLGKQDRDCADAYWRSALADYQSTPFPPLPPSVQQPVADMTVEYQCPPCPRTSSDFTASTLIRAAWTVVVSRYTGSEDVVFGTTVTGRNAPVAGIEDMIGPTIATMPVRVQVLYEQTVSAYLEALQRQATEMVPYEQTGLHHIARISADARHACDFQTLLVIQPAENGLSNDETFGVWRTTSEQQGISTYALTLQCFLAVEGIKIIANFDSKVVDPWKLQKMLGQFSFVMQQLAEAGQRQTVADIDLLTQQDKEELWGWYKTMPAAVEKCVHDLIEEQARAQPDSPAVCAWDGELTHGKLDELATRLAHRLVGLGVGPEVVVPLCFEKSVWTVVAMLAVLKAGGAFILLDPSHPSDRLELLCRKVFATIAVASCSSVQSVKGFIQTVVVVGKDAINKLPSPELLNRAVGPNNAAYVIFTSGSTGEPKGCKIEHRSYCSAALGHGPALGIHSGTRSLQFGSYSFAGAIMEILMTLIHGGCICIPSEDERRSNLGLAINKMNANWAFLTSSVLKSLEPESVPSLRTLCVGGEPIQASQIHLWANKVQLRQTYGSAETSAVVSSARLVEVSTTRDVGKAATGRYWIVDPTDSNKLAPVGAIGEVVIEGPVIGREYIGEPDKTAATFIEAPSWRGLFGQHITGSRFYKSGDLAAYKSDGAIELMGRKDTQVKLRGQRIELGEIEYQARLASPHLAEIAVDLIIPRGSDRKMPILAGFVVVQNKQEERTASSNKSRAVTTHTRTVLEAVQERLERFLPQYMVPTVFIPRPELPMTASGKTDRKRLREIGASFSPQQLAEMRMAVQAKKRQPTTKAECQLQQLWAQVLNIDPSSIGLDDSFFRLGGDSIMAMKLVGEARKAGIALTVAEVFRRPKLADLALLEISQINGMAEEIPAFTLLGSNIDAQSFREEVAASYNIDAALIEDIYPCTPLQEGLLSLTSKRPGDYIMQNVLELSPDLQNDAFRAAWEETVRSTAVLRTRIVQHSQLGMLQVVIAEGIQWIEVNELEDYLKKDKLASMEPGQPLARYALVKDGKGTHKWFVWTVHHALYDGWSLPRVMDMVSHAYRGNPLRVQREFKAFVKYLGEQDRGGTEAYWRSVLADCQSTPFPALPSSVQQPVADTTVQHQCPPLLRTGVEITASTIIRAAWALVASRYTSSGDVVFGAIVTGRNAPVAGIENMAGPTIATVPVRVQMLGKQTVTAYLETLQQQATEMIPYEQTGLQRIAKMCADARHACDFQTLLVTQPAEDGFGSDETLGVWQTSAAEQGFSTYALTLQCILDAEGIKIIASFDSKVVDPWKLQKMLGQFSFVMQQLAEAGQRQTVADIDLLTQQDKEELWGWHKTMPAVVKRCVHHLIEEQARAQPDSPAVCAWDGELTHGELDDLATRLAHRLVGLGVGPEVMVPLCFEKSLWTVVAMLAVLKAGGAFLLLDPSHPPDRLKLLCRKASATIALASRLSVSSIQGFIQTVVVVGKDAINQLPSPKPLNTTVGPNNAAYVIFTSGSTGEPKGCKIEHMSYCSAALGHGPALGIHSGTRSLQFGSYSFAGAIMEILMTLIHGGCICIPSEDERRSNLGLAINKMNANWAFLTSSVLKSLEPESVPSLRTLCVGGEPIQASQIYLWANKVQLRQTYGSAETSAVVSSARLVEVSTTRDVGKAATGRYWIVDPTDSNKLAPVGAIGEVVIEGPVIGREYIGEPDKTAATFIEAPSWRGFFGQHITGSRFYKSGDLAAYKNDGAIELMGRKDTQVKLRGQRIELGEIEYQARLASPHLAEIAVDLIIPRGGDRKMPILAGFVVVRDEQEERAALSGESSAVNTRTQAALEAVQERLERLLPQYMVPTVFIPRPELPMTASGKTDRKRLREIGASFSSQQLAEMRMAVQAKKRQPTTKAECQLQQLWAQVLNIDPSSIGLDDSFFRLGGDSIMAMKLVGEARKAGIALTVANVFRRPKLVDLAGQVISLVDGMPDEIPAFSLLASVGDEASLRNEIASCYSIEAALIEDIYPCTPLQEGLLSLTSKRPGDYIMQNVLKLSSDLRHDAFQAAWEETVRSTAVLRTRIVQHGQLGLLQVVLKESIRWEKADGLEGYLEQDRLASMEPGQPLARYAIVKDAKGVYSWFVWTIHHALYDGWSLPRVMDMVSRAYRGHPLRVQREFKAFVKYLGEQDRASTKAYWRSVLADCQSTPFPALPSSVQQPVADTTVEHQCPPLSRTGVEITASTIIRAAWALVASRYTSSGDVVFGAIVTGRNAPVAGIENMAGPTIATVPVRVQMLGKQTVTAYLETLQQQATEMIPYEQTGLQRIAKICSDAQHACDFQTLLVIQPAEDGFGSDETLGVWQTSAAEQGFSTYALTLQCILAAEGIKIIASFDSKVVDPWKLQKMLGQFSFVMQQLAGAGQRQTVADIDLLTQQDQEELWGWHKTMPAVVKRCVHHLIEEQARAQLDSPAVCAWDGELTHGELDDLATRLAHRLVGLGVGPEVMVPLCFEKSLWTVVAMLAVLKAGGAFLLLDPSHPPDRLKLLCRKASATVALASPSSVPSIQGFIQTVVVVGKDAITQLPLLKPLNTTVGPNNAAYVIFTSGSTGEPKGCKIEHMSYCSAALGHGPALGIHSGTRSLQFGSYSFAGAIMETLMVLIHGGCVCIPSEDERRSDVGLAICNLKANWAFLTSSVLATFEPKSVPSLTTLCVGGEPVRAFQIQQWANKVQLRQTYGSAETSAAVSSARLTKASTIGDVGKAATGRYWIVDPADSNKLAPIGAIGEVMIEGPIIGREYVGEPDKTASTFIQAPSWRGRFGQCTRESRFYKSGDLAVYKNDGAIELIGRKDTQVKLRGQRIELGEIEHQARLASPYVRDVAVEPVIPQDGSSKNPVLVGFIVVQVEKRVESNGDSKTVNMSTQAVMEAVQERLERILPHYMVPTVLIPLPKLPMTTSKKTNRKRLREIGASFSLQQFTKMRVAGQTERRQPTTEAEHQLQQLWAQVLNIDPGSIGLDDSFFRLGGDSIIAMKLVGEARKAGIALTVAEVFRRPKLVDLARLEIGQIDDMAEEIPPFTLLGSTIDAQSVREEVAAGYNIDAAIIEDIYPCTPLQEGLLSLTSKHPGDYIMQNVLELSSDLQNDAFRAAWEETVRSTAVLRTRIVQHGQLGLLQVVLAESIKWSQADELEDYLKKDKLAVMELGQPLARYALVKDGKGTNKWFVWTVHHALYDGWSLPRVIDMVSRAYRGTPLGERQEFKALVKHLGKQDRDCADAYWRSALADYQSTPFPPLPPSVQQPVADMTVEYQCPPCPRTSSDFTASTLIRAAWTVVVSRYTGSEDVVFGTTVTGRNAPVAGIEDMIGPTIATMPVRVQVLYGQRVSMYLEALQRQATEMVPYEQTGLHHIARMSADARHACDFQTLLVIQPAENGLSRDETFGVWRTTSKQQGFSTYALTLQCILAAEGIKIIASFDSKVVDPWKLQKMLGQFSFVMQQLAEAGQRQTVADINLLTQQDKEELWGWHKTMPAAVERCVHHLIEEQARARPSSPAVCAWDGELTYSELDDLSTRLARRLTGVGVGPEVMVPLCFEKSLWTIVAMLAVLKAGGAFILLDPSLPSDRLKLLCRKVFATVAVASRSSVQSVEGFVQTVIVIDEEVAYRLPISVAPQTSVGPDNAAYVIFTSGSTGEPKGCKIEHRSYCSAALGHGPALGMHSSTRSLQFGSYSFAGAIMEILMTLIHGGCMCIPSEDERRSNLGLAINKMNANWAFLTSSVLKSLEPESVPSLRTLCVGGEPIQASQIHLWANKVQLRQTYGSAETSAVVSSARLVEVSTTRDVGKAATGRYWIVDPTDSNKLAPVGAIGEVVIEGPVIGREYIGEPDKTAATFIEAPSWRGLFGQHITGSRFYKSGDLAAYKNDGAIELMGRKDTQVKLRGQRIELGEIEYQARLASPHLAEIAVDLIIPRGGDRKMPILAGFVVVRDEQEERAALSGESRAVNTRMQAALEAVQERLERFLPQYMVPTVFIPRPELPMTASGKTDRKRLREIGASFSPQQLAEMRMAVQVKKRQPTTKAECQLQQLWAQVLNIDPSSIGLDDSFFRLGGDSIMAMKLVGEARKAGIALTVANVFRCPKLADLACLGKRAVNDIPKDITPFSLLEHAIKEPLLSQLDSVRVGLQSISVVDILPLTDFQEECINQGIKSPRQSFNYFFLDFGTYAHVPRLKHSCRLVLEQFPILRAAFIAFLGRHWQVILREFDPPFRILDVDDDLQQASQALCLQDTEHRLQPGYPPTAFILVRHKIQGYRLVVRLSHAQYDGTCLPVILRALVNSYQQKPLGSSVDFSAYLAYSIQQRSSSIAYWRKLLKGSHITRATSKLRSYTIYDTTAHKVQAEAVTRTPQLPSNITTASLVSSAWAVLLSHVTGKEDVVYGCLTAGRNAAIPGIEEIVGPCVNIVPVRAWVSPQQTPTELLLSIQEQYISLGEADSLGLRDIIRHCTEWPAETKLDSVIQHQNINEQPEVQFGGTPARLQWFNNPHYVPHTLGIVSYPEGDYLRIRVFANTHIISAETANAIVASLCEIIAKLSSNINTPLSSCLSAYVFEA